MQFEGQGKFYQPWLCHYVMFVYRNSSSIKNGCTTTITSHQKYHQLNHVFSSQTFTTTLYFPPISSPMIRSNNTFSPSTNSTNPTIQLPNSTIQLLNPNPYLEDINNPTPQPTTHPTNQPTHNLKDIMHVEGCNQVWAGDLSCETKALVRKVGRGRVDWRMVVNMLHRAAKWSSNDVLFTSRLFPRKMWCFLEKKQQLTITHLT